MSWVDLVKALAPIIITAKVPHGDIVAPLVQHGIEVAETTPGATKLQKLAIARDLTITGAKSINAAYGREKLNVDAINGTIDSGISAVVDTVNAISKAKKIPVSNQVITPAVINE